MGAGSGAVKGKVDMAARGSQVSVTTTATRLDLDPQTSNQPFAGVFTNRGAVAVFLGGSGVTTAGYQLDPGQSLPLDLDRAGANGLYGIVAAGTCRVDVLQVGA